MANILGIVTAVLLALAAFIALKNKDAFKNEIAHRQEAESRLAASKTRLAKAREDLNSTQKSLSDTRDEVAKRKDSESKLVKDIDDIKTQIDTKEQQRKGLADQVKTVEAKVAESGQIDDLLPKIKAMSASVTDSTDRIAECDVKLANFTDQNKKLDGSIAVIKKDNADWASGASYFKSTRISSIFPKWGFVTLSSGSSAGVVPNSSLEVLRDGQPIAKLLVSAVEKNTATATIFPETLAKDVVLMVGDKVVPAASKSATPEPAPDATPAPAAAPTPAPEPAADAAPAPEPAPAAADPFGSDPAPTPEKPAEPDPFSN